LQNKGLIVVILCIDLAGDEPERVVEFDIYRDVVVETDDEGDDDDEKTIVASDEDRDRGNCDLWLVGKFGSKKPDCWYWIKCKEKCNGFLERSVSMTEELAKLMAKAAEKDKGKKGSDKG
jgi:hypothetical protein